MRRAKRAPRSIGVGGQAYSIFFTVISVICSYFTCSRLTLHYSVCIVRGPCPFASVFFFFMLLFWSLLCLEITWICCRCTAWCACSCPVSQSAKSTGPWNKVDNFSIFWKQSGLLCVPRGISEHHWLQSALWHPTSCSCNAAMLIYLK